MEREAQKVLVSSIRRLIRAEQIPQLKRVVAKTHSADLAACFGALTIGQQLTVLRHVPTDASRGDILSELEPSILSNLIEEVSDSELSAILSEMPNDDTNYVLQVLDDDRSALLLEAMSDEHQSEATSILAYESDSAGALMVTDFLAFHQEVTAGEAVRVIQEGADDAEIVFYIYVTNEIGQLVGVTSLREVVQQPTKKALKEFMIPDVIRVNVDTDQEDVAKLVAKYNLLALPVVEGANELVGVVTVDDIIDVIRHEANEDMLRMAGAGHEQDISVYRNPWENARTRLPWLASGLLTGVVGMLVIHMWSNLLDRLILLAAFLPLLFALSRNVGLQSATIVTRAIAMGQIEFGRLGRVVLREFVVGLICGGVYGLIAGLVAASYSFYTTSSVELASVFALSVSGGVISTMLVSTLAGTVLPLLFERWKLDPATVGGPLFASSMDVISAAIYLGMASAILG